MVQVYHLQMEGVSVTFERKEGEDDLEEEVVDEQVA